MLLPNTVYTTVLRGFQFTMFILYFIRHAATIILIVFSYWHINGYILVLDYQLLK